MKEPKYSGQTFTIASIEDIWRLPTIDQMKRCLEEFTAAMVQSRHLEEVMLSMMDGMGVEKPERALDCSLPFTWTDDKADDLTVRIKDDEPEGEVVFTMKQTANQEQP